MNARVILPIVFFLVLVSGTFAWWNTDWKYRAHVNINGTIGNEYQVKILLDTTSLIADGKMRPDCGDIRVIDTDDLTELPYWIKDGTCNTTQTEIWTKLNISSAPETIYIYYGNSNALTTQNCSNVFQFCDDFEDGDYAGWSALGGASIVGVENGRLHTVTTDVFQVVIPSKTISRSNDIIIEAKLETTSNYVGLGFLIQDAGNYYLSRGEPSYRISKLTSGSSWASLASGTSVPAGNWIYTVSFSGDSSENIYASINGDTVSATDITFTQGYVGIGSQMAGTANEYLDWILVRDKVTLTGEVIGEASLLLKVKAFDEDTLEEIQNFTIYWNNESFSTTNGTIYLNRTTYNGTGFMVIDVPGYTSRQLFIKDLSQSIDINFYLVKSQNAVNLNIDVRENDTADLVPNTFVEVWYGDLHLYDGYSDSNGFLVFPGDPLKEYTIKFNNISAPWAVQIVIGPISDEKTGNTINATEENLRVVLLNSSYQKEVVNQSYVVFTRYDIQNYDVPWGDVSVIVEGDTYPARKYYIYVDNSRRVRLIPRLLSIYNGINAKFVVKDPNGNPLYNAQITFRRLYGVSYKTVAQIRTDSAGQAQAFLDPYARYLVHVDADGYIWDGEIEPQPTTYYIIVGNLKLEFQLKRQVEIGINPSRPKYGDLINISIYDPQGRFEWYNVKIVYKGNVLFNYTGYEPNGETLIINTSEYQAPASTFEFWEVQVTYKLNDSIDPGLDFALYFTDILGTGMDWVLKAGEQWIPDNMRVFVALIFTIFLAGATAVYLGATAGFVVGIIVALILAYYNWMPLLAVIISIGAGGFYMYYSSRRVG